MSDAVPVVQLIDDDEAVRGALSLLLTSAGLRSRSFPSGEAFLEVAGDLPPGCIVTDVKMGGIGGLDLFRRLRAMGVHHPVIIITGHGEVPLAVEAMKQGAADFLEKPFGDETFLEAVRRAVSAQAEAAARDNEVARDRQALAALSRRETDVLDGLMAGKSNKQIARDLGIGPRTVEEYRANVMSKTDCASLPELVRRVLAAR
jgi:two-component system, LuxR family, response regulator FixJ